MNDENTPLKGKKHGNCNITACQKPNSAVWYNHGTSKWYCEECAKWLNEDRFNKADAMRMFGHDLCTHMDDPNSPQTYVSLELNEEDMKARLEYACGIDPINGGIHGEKLLLAHSESGVGKSRLVEHLLAESNDPVIVQGGTSCGKSVFMDELVYKLEPNDCSYPELFAEEPNFFTSKLVQNGKRKKKKR